MTAEGITSYFQALQPNQKVHFLALLAHNITVRARGAYPGQIPQHEATKKLCAFNEIQHSITDQLGSMLEGSDKRYPDDTFIRILFETARGEDLEGDLIAAYKLVLLTRSLSDQEMLLPS